MSDTHPSSLSRLGILASGRGSNLQALLDAQDSGLLRARVAVVISDVGDSAALARARRHGVAAVHVDPGSPRARLRPEVERSMVEVLRENGVDWIVLAGFFRIVGPVFLGAFPLRVLNIHPSLLPSFPGLHGPGQALAYGVRVAGCTVHLVTTEVDAGPIVRQAPVAVLADDTEATLAARILEQEHRILLEAVNEVATRRFHIDGRTVCWDRDAAPSAAGEGWDAGAEERTTGEREAGKEGNTT